MKNIFFEFCALCFRTTKSGLSAYYCYKHQPKTNLYNSDRLKIKNISETRFNSLTGHIEKIHFLSDELDKLSTSPTYLIANTRKVRHNGKLSFEPVFNLVENHYKKAFLNLENNSFSPLFLKRWTAGYLTRLGYQIEDYHDLLDEITDTELFELIIFVSARFQAYHNLKEQFPDGRKKRENKKLSEYERSKYLTFINSLPRKPNGRVCRRSLGKATGDSRHKASRIIAKLKSSGDINGDI